MSLGAFQACLARLYVDEAFRTSFATSPAAALHGQVLAEAEFAALAALDLTQLARMAQTLRAKHRRRLARRYPLTAADRERFDAAHGRFYRLHGPRTEAEFDAQATAFGRFVDEMYSGEDAEAQRNAPAWYGEIARYERQRLIAAQRDESPLAPSPRTIDKSGRPGLAAGASVATYRFAIHAWARSRAGDPVPVTGEPVALLVHRPRGAPRPQVIEINAATRALVDACDGRRDLEAIVAQVEDALGRADLEPAVLRNLGLLAAQGAIGG